MRSRIISSLNAFVLTRTAGFLFVLFQTHSQMFFLSSLITSNSHSLHLQPRVTTWTFYITRNNETKPGDNKLWLEEEKNSSLSYLRRDLSNLLQTSVGKLLQQIILNLLFIRYVYYSKVLDLISNSFRPSPLCKRLN